MKKKTIKKKKLKKYSSIDVSYPLEYDEDGFSTIKDEEDYEFEIVSTVQYNMIFEI